MIEEKIEEIGERLGSIIARFNEYQRVITQLKQENENLKHRLNELEGCAAHPESAANDDTFTQKSLGKEEKEAIRKEINELVREIDHCIGYINGK